MGKKIKTFFLSILTVGLVINYAAVLLYEVLVNIAKGTMIKPNLFPSHIVYVILISHQDKAFCVFFVVVNTLVLFFSFYLAFISEAKEKILRTGINRVTDKISIPVPAGNGQYGNSHFMNLKELSSVKEIHCFEYKPEQKRKPQKGGLVLGINEIGELPLSKEKKESILYVGEDRHVLLVGATRSGKSRRMIILSIWLTILAEENIVTSDPKGELFAYTSRFAEQNGYNVVALDFRSPNKGNHYNYLQEILDALATGDVAEAIDLVWDLVAVIVGEAKGEPIWHNGECATIAAVILIVAIDAPAEYRNLANVYYFLYNMAKPDDDGKMPISHYLQELPETHPARAVFAMAELAHHKTRGSFFTSALGTLKYFINPKVAEMTSSTDYSFSEMAHQKTIVYIILPDEKTTLYSLGSMYIMQHYIYNVKEAIRNGGRCPIDWWYFLDEFGQLPYIPPVPQFLSVGAGRGMRFVLAVQDFQQIEKKYKEDYGTIKNNCDFWIYLKCANEETLKAFSGRCGNYTVQVNSTNFSDKKNKSGESHSASLTGRNLLLPEEVGMIESPYSLVSISGKFPLLLIAPDLSYYYANEDLGLGDEAHNRALIIEIEKRREARRVGDINVWGIWNKYTITDEYDLDRDQQEEDGIFSFLKSEK